MNAELLLRYISFLGLVQGTLLCVLLLFKKGGNNQTNILLAMLIAVLTLQFAIPLISSALAWKTLTATYASLFLIGPLLYLYIKSFSSKIHWKIYLIQFSWFAVYLLIIIYYANRLQPFVENNTNQLPLRPLAFFILISKFLQMLFYYLLCLRAIKEHQEIIKNNFAEVRKMDLSWIKQAVNIYAGIVLVAALLNAGTYALSLNIDTIGVVNSGFTMVFIYSITLKGFYEQGIVRQGNFGSLDEVKDISRQKNSDQSANQRNNLAQLNVLSAKVVDQLDIQKLFLDPELTLLQLANMVNSKPHLVSEAINTILMKSFYDLVNGYRVEEAKKLLTEETNNQLKISYIGLMAGFNSKTTFNTFFKQSTGRTPTQYRLETNKQQAGTAI
jgi:AraC-like DNA-binding protein